MKRNKKKPQKHINLRNRQTEVNRSTVGEKQRNKRYDVLQLKQTPIYRNGL